MSMALASAGHTLAKRRRGNPGRVEKVKLQLPADVDYQTIPQDRTLSHMLDTGEIDGLFTARTPSCFSKGSPNVKRLSADYVNVEKEYYRKTQDLSHHARSDNKEVCL